MRGVLQRVSQARVTVDGLVTGEIGTGLVVLLGVAKGDTTAEADWLLDKIVNLRIFEDDAGKMNRSVLDLPPPAGLLIISQFTLYGDTRKGRRPSFDLAAPAAEAKALYEYFVEKARLTGLAIGTGIFQATMSVELINEGPVTLIVETPGTASGSS